jgi:hypothetical protein
MDSKRCAVRFVLGLAALVGWGCNRSGQTGSPAEERPRYETPGRFSPMDPGGGTNNPDNPSLGGNRPTYDAKGGELLALLPSAHAVAAVSDRGVLVYDVAEPTKPRLVGQLPIRGSIFQLELEEDGEGGAPSIVVLAQETLGIDEPSVPEESPRNSALRMIRVDLSDPTAPERVAEIDLEGDAWLFVRRGAHYLVLSEWYEPSETGCGQTLADDWGPATRAMRVTDYVLEGGSFALRASVELPADESFAFPAGDAIYVPTGFYSGEEQGRGSQVSWAEFSGGSLVERGPIAVDGRLASIAREDGLLVTLAERGDRNMLLQTWTLDGQGNAVARGQLPLSAEMQTLELLPGAQRLLVSGLAGVLVDLSDLGNPRVLHRFPADVQRFATVAQGVIALGASDTGRLVASLWTVPAQGSPQIVSRFASSWAWTNTDPSSELYSVDREHDLLLAPINVSGVGQAAGLGVARIEADGLHEYGRYALRQAANRPITDGKVAYSWGYEGLEVVALVEGANQSSPSSGFAPFYEPKAIARLDQLSSAGRELVLRERSEDGRYVVEVRADGTEAKTVVLDFRGDALVAIGDRVVVVGVRWDSECEYIDPAGNPEANPNPGEAAFDRCAPYRRRGLSVLDLQDEPTVVASFALSSDLDFEPLDGVTAETVWSGYVQLEDGRLLFPVERFLRCGSEASCKALSTPAYESVGSPGCNPQVQNCADLPTMVTFTSGAKASLMLYTLDDIAGEPSLELATEIDGRFQLPGEGPVDVGWQLLRSADGFAFAREEPIYNEEGNSVLNEHEDAIVRFYLDRVAIGEDGGLRALPSVNTPGRPVAWDGEHVYTVEPTYDEDGDVVVRALRSQLRDDAAHIEESVAIGPGFLDARAVGDQLAVLRGPADPCTPDARTALFTISLQPGAMKKSKAIDLPTRIWSFPYGPATGGEDLLLVRGGPLFGQAHLEVDISDPAQPQVVRYTTASP